MRGRVHLESGSLGSAALWWLKMTMQNYIPDHMVTSRHFGAPEHHDSRPGEPWLAAVGARRMRRLRNALGRHMTIGWTENRGRS
jgi:hypothetical protein